MKILKVKNVKTPKRVSAKSAGIDFFVPEVKGFHSILGPGNRVNIPSGIKVEVPFGYALIAFDNSDISVKTGLILSDCVVDEHYKNEIHFNVINTSNEEVKLISGQKLAQLLLVPVFHDTLELIDNDHFN